MAGWRWWCGGGSGARAGRVYGHADGFGRQEDPGDQGRARAYGSGSQGGQGPGRRCAEAGQGRRKQGRGGGCQEKDRRCWGIGRAEVRSRTAFLANNYLRENSLENSDDLGRRGISASAAAHVIVANPAYSGRASE